MTVHLTYRIPGATAPVATTEKGSPLTNAEIDGNLKSLKDAIEDISAPGGSALVEHDGGTVQDVLDSAKPMANYTALRAYTGRATSVRITTPGIAGFFTRDSDVVTADNGGTVIVDASGRRWKRVFDGDIEASWFVVGNGIANDSAALDTAINQGKNVHLSSNLVCFCESGVNLITPFTEIYGDGTIKLSSSAPNATTLLTISADYCTVSGVTIDCGSASSARGIAPTNTTRTTLRNITHINGGQMFIRASGIVRDLVVDGCYSLTKGYGVLVQDPSFGSYGVTVINNVFAHPATGQGDGIEINCPTNGIDNVVISNNTVIGSWNSSLNAGIGIGLAKCRNATITGNVVRGTEGDGIHVEDVSVNVTISGNTVEGCCISSTNTTAGICVVTGCANVTVVGNTVKDTITRYGFGTTSASGEFCTDVTVVGNTFYGSERWGVLIESVKDFVFSGNIIKNVNVINDANISAIRVAKFTANVNERIKIKDNIVKQGSNAVRSVAIAPSSLIGGEVCGNDFTSCTTKAVDAGGNSVDVYGNKMSTDQMYGTITLSAGTSTTVTNGNADAIQNICLAPLNSAARTLGIPHVSGITRASIFTLGHATAAGTEQYSYRIL